MLNRQNKLVFAHCRKHVFKAAVRAVEDHPKIKLKDQSEAAGFISATVGMSLFSWGEDISITVIENTEGHSEVAIESASKYAAVDYGKNAKNITELINAISNNLKKIS